MLSNEIPAPTDQRAQEMRNWFKPNEAQAKPPEKPPEQGDSLCCSVGECICIPWWQDAWELGSPLPNPQPLNDAAYVLRRWPQVDRESLRVARINNNDNAPTLNHFDHVIVSLNIPASLHIGLYYIDTPHGIQVRRLVPLLDGSIHVMADVPAQATPVLPHMLRIRAIVLAGLQWRYVE
jgi:hypothetical protein